MTSKKLLKQAGELQKEAVRILDELGIMKILGSFTEPEIVGSVKNGLMVLTDIDIRAYMSSPDIKTVVGLLPHFAVMPTIQKVQFSNFREHRQDYRKDRVNFPRGYYIGLRSSQPSGVWKIDIWFGEKEIFDDFDEKELEKLTDKQKVSILRLKMAMKNGNEEFGYRGGAVSIDFYKAVLYHEVRAIDEFSRYLKTKYKKHEQRRLL